MLPTLYKYGKIFRILFPSLLWKVKTDEKIIYLTFDDGPVPIATEFVLDTLQKFNAKATFFSVGENIIKNPEIFKRIQEEGHSTGNHTFNHLNGRKTEYNKYLENIALCKAAMNNKNNDQALFRAPYGKITLKQIKTIKTQYKIVMWDVLSQDYNPSQSVETCLEKSIKYSDKGTIIVFHDSIKNIEKLKQVLPLYLDHFSKKGFIFEAL